MADDVVIRLSTSGAGRTRAEIVNVAESFDRIGDAARRSVAEATGQLGRLDQRLQRIGQINAGQGLKDLGSTLTRAVSLPLGLVGAASVKMAADFDRSFSQVIGLTDVTASQAENLREQVVALAGETAKSPQELAEALYFVASAGGDVSNIMATLTVSAKAAAAGLGETATVAGLVSGVMGAYGDAALTAAQTTDVLVAAVRTGRAEPAEFAETLGRVLPLAGQLGVSFQDVAAAVAVMSNGALDADEATTGLRQILADILHPAEQSKQQLLAIGISSEELRRTLREKGLLATLKQLEGQIGGNQEALGEIIPDVRALTSVLSLLGQEPEKVARVFEATASSAGSLASAFDQFRKSASGQLQQALVDNQAALLDIGNALLPLAADVLPRIATAVKTMADAFDALPGPLQSLVVMGGAATFAAGPMLRLAGTVVQFRTAQALAAASATAFVAPMNSAASVADLYANNASRAERATGFLKGALGGLAVTAGMTAVVTAYKHIADAAKEAADAVAEERQRRITAVGADLQARLNATRRELRDAQKELSEGAGGGLLNLDPRSLIGLGTTEGEKRLLGNLKSVDDLKKDILDLRAQLTGQEADAKRAGAATRQYGQDNEGAVAPTKALAEAAKAWQDNLVINPILDAASASRAYEREVEKLNAMVADSGNTERERAEAVEEAQQRIESAKRSLADAEERYAEALAGTTELERDRLRVSLDQAKVAAGQAKLDVSVAEERQSRLSPGASPKARAEAAQALEAAQVGLDDANTRVRESQKAIDDATPGSVAYQERLAEASADVRDARRDVTKAYRDAQQPAKALADRERDLAEQLDRVVKAAQGDIYGKMVTQGWSAEQATAALRDRLIEVRDLAPTLAGPLNDLITLLGSPVLRPTPFARRADEGRALGGIDAFIAHNQIIRMAEPQTGGEAYIPRLGISRSRGLSILDVAAGWYGARVTPMAEGGILGAGGRQYAQAEVRVIMVEKTTVENYNQNAPVQVQQDMEAFQRWQRQQARQKSLSRGSRGRRG